MQSGNIREIVTVSALLLLKARLVEQCFDELSELNLQVAVTPGWVPGHRNIQGNERADVLARNGSELNIALQEQVRPPPYPIQHSNKHSLLREFKWNGTSYLWGSPKNEARICTKEVEGTLKVVRPQYLQGYYRHHRPLGSRGFS